MKRSTKKSLLLSILALVLCTAMLLGTTFAWFTDSANTAVNKIQAGRLEIQLLDDRGNSLEGKTLTWQKAAGAPENEQVLWEPGCTYKLQPITIKNNGNLALKYKIEITGIQGDAELNEAIEWTISNNEHTYAIDQEVSLAADATAKLTIQGHMKEEAGNNYQGKSIDGIGITVYATQYTAEFDSIGNEYDKNAPIVYPANVTTESFESATSVYYYGTYGGGSNIHIAEGDEIQAHPAAVAYVDADGVHYAADVYSAVANGATTIYCKENATLKARSVDTNRTQDLTKDLTIYANGANFQYGEIALNGATTAANDITVKVYDAKNLYIWGYSPAGGKAFTVLMENCHNVGTSETKNAGRMFYISNKNDRTNGTIHATLRSCSVEKSNSPVYMNADGSLTLENCTFTRCAVPVNNNHKSAGTRKDVVKDCTFISCGCTAEMDSGLSTYAAPIRFVESGNGRLTVTLKNNTFSGTIGSNGDILLGDYITPGKSFAFDATIVTENPVMVKSSADAAYSYNGGTVNVGNY